MGDHQLDNAATATAAACLLKGDGFLRINEDTIAEGLSTASLPGRFQVQKIPKTSVQFAESYRGLLWVSRKIY